MTPKKRKRSEVRILPSVVEDNPDKRRKLTPRKLEAPENPVQKFLQKFNFSKKRNLQIPPVQNTPPEDQGTALSPQKTEKEMFLSRFSQAKLKFENSPKKRNTTPISNTKKESTTSKLHQTTPNNSFKKTKYQVKNLKVNVDEVTINASTTPKNPQDLRNIQEIKRGFTRHPSR